MFARLLVFISALAFDTANGQCGTTSHVKYGSLRNVRENVFVSSCPSWIKSGFCTNTFYALANRQQLCGRECGLCATGTVVLFAVGPKVIQRRQSPL